jgi:hypothetical protein
VREGGIRYPGLIMSVSFLAESPRRELFHAVLPSEERYE